MAAGSASELGLDGSIKVRAAQYVRMSTEHQKYSTANQADTIRLYAEEHSIAIVRTYADEGRSGLTIKERPGLRSLISDVFSGHADFTTILVYDVSRWGRFQDVDEAAHLEYLCRSAGVAIHYCAEEFPNDGSISAIIVKSVKRAMAAEYSRELSAKVRAGQRRIASMGFHTGGSVPIGLRRILVDENRHVKGELRRGEYKNIQSDRIVLVPGPPDEIATVRRIYRLFVRRRLNESQIAALLNREGIRTDLGRRWRRGTVHKVLTNEKYLGNIVRDLTSFRLHQKRVSNPPHMVLRVTGAFPAIVDRKLFDAACAIIKERTRNLTDDEMLARLRTLWRGVGTLSYAAINACEDLPSAKHYAYRFGSLARAYERIGFKPSRDFSFVESSRTLRQLRSTIVEDLAAAIQNRGGMSIQQKAIGLLTINEEFTVRVVVARCTARPGHSLRWEIFPSKVRADLIVIARMAADNRAVLDYYLLPETELGLIDCPLFERNGFDIDAYRSDTLEPLLDLVARSRITASPEKCEPVTLAAMPRKETTQAKERVGRRRASRALSLERSPRRRAEKLFRMYRREIDRQKRMVGKAQLNQSRLAFVADACRRLFADEHFVTLLRAEGIRTFPRALAGRLGG